MKRRSLLILASLFTTSWAQASNWEKIDDEDGLKVYRKQINGSSFLAFMGIKVIDAPVDKLLWVLADNQYRRNWVDRLKKSVVLEHKNAYEFILYQHFGAPPLVSDRDYVYRAKAIQNKHGQVVLKLQSVKHSKAPATVGVRGQLYSSSYTLTPQPDGKTKVVVEIHTDPMGSLPAWIVNLIQKSWPRNTLTALSKEVRKAHVKAMALPPKQ